MDKGLVYICGKEISEVSQEELNAVIQAVYCGRSVRKGEVFHTVSSNTLQLLSAREIDNIIYGLDDKDTFINCCTEVVSSSVYDGLTQKEMDDNATTITSNFYFEMLMADTHLKMFSLVKAYTHIHKRELYDL